MEFVYIFGCGTLFGVIVTMIAFKGGAKTYAKAVESITTPPGYTKEDTDVGGTDPESWDWDVYDNYIKGIVEEDPDTPK